MGAVFSCLELLPVCVLIAPSRECHHESVLSHFLHLAGIVSLSPHGPQLVPDATSGRDSFKGRPENEPLRARCFEMA